MEYPNHRQCCATCANWKEPNRVVSPDRSKVATEQAKACCQAFSGTSEEMSAGRGACPKFRKLSQLK